MRASFGIRPNIRIFFDIRRESSNSRVHAIAAEQERMIWPQIRGRGQQMGQITGKMKRPGSLTCRMPAAGTDKKGSIDEMTYRKKLAIISLKGGAFR